MKTLTLESLVAMYPCILYRRNGYQYAKELFAGRIYLTPNNIVALPISNFDKRWVLIRMLTADTVNIMALHFIDRFYYTWKKQKRDFYGMEDDLKALLTELGVFNVERTKERYGYVNRWSSLFDPNGLVCYTDELYILKNTIQCAVKAISMDCDLDYKRSSLEGLFKTFTNTLYPECSVNYEDHEEEYLWQLEYLVGNLNEEK